MPPTDERRCMTDSGSVRSKAPNMEADIARNTATSPTTTHWFASSEPKRPPVSAATTSIGVNSATMPRTKLVERSIASARDFASRAPKTLTVMAIIGYTQGVSDTPRPPRNAATPPKTGPFATQRVNRSGSPARATPGTITTARAIRAATAKEENRGTWRRARVLRVTFMGMAELSKRPRRARLERASGTNGAVSPVVPGRRASSAPGRSRRRARSPARRARRGSA